MEGNSTHFIIGYYVQSISSLGILFEAVLEIQAKLENNRIVWDYFQNCLHLNL